MSFISSNDLYQFLPCSSFLICLIVTATTEIHTLSLHDALPICGRRTRYAGTDTSVAPKITRNYFCVRSDVRRDRKSTRLNSSHRCISYAVFCLKKKKMNLAKCCDDRPLKRTTSKSILINKY